MSSSTVTVVIPTKDRAELLALTLASVLRQRHVAVDVVVVDDGGQPGTEDLVRALAPAATVVRHETSRGVSASRNSGLARATTPWVAFLDDDDLWSADKLARQLQAMAAAPASLWTCSTAVMFTGAGEVLGLQHPPERDGLAEVLHTRNTMPGGGSGVVVDRQLMYEIGGFDERLSSLADWDCWIRLAERAPLATVCAPDVGYRIHATSMLHDNARSERELSLLLDKHADSRARLGVEFDRTRWDYARERLAYSGGHWLVGAQLSWVLATRHRQYSAAVKPLAELLPQFVHRARRHRRLDPDRALVEQARAWLAEHPLVGPA